MPRKPDTAPRSLREPSETVKPRPPREPLTRERIVRTALRLMDDEGLEAVTMRRVGRELGVEAMSLYNHVGDKEDILDGVTELVMGEYEFPEPAEDWERTIREAARAWRRVLTAHPRVVTLLTERKHPLASIGALRPMDFALDVLRNIGLSKKDTVRAFRAFGSYIMGFALMEVGNVVAGPHEGGEQPSVEELRRTLPADLLPRMTELVQYLANCDMDEEFEFGIELLIAGLRAKLGR